MYCRTKTSFSLRYPQNDPARLLSLLASTVEAHGGDVEQLSPVFTLIAHFQQRQSGACDSGNSGEPLGTVETPQQAPSDAMKGGGADVSGPEKSSACASDASLPEEDKRLAKRQRTAGNTDDAQPEQEHIVFAMTMRLRKESAGCFAVLALLLHATQQDRTAAAVAFSAKCVAIQRDIEQLLLSM